MRAKSEKIGGRYGHWTVLAFGTRRASNGCVYWVCRCDCGVEREVLGSGLRTGRTTSCGCGRIWGTCAGVPVEPLVIAYRQSGLPASEIARRCGWLDRGHGDSLRLLRRLGLSPSYSQKGKRREKVTPFVTPHVAQKIAGALNLDPVDVGF